ncbi:L-idonate 5-dehydrogenase [Mycolicibacterium goodii]|uniref:Theronine dehydrogenase n=1 Tax=Mycolicibacterium goodii TaxID=134601 RepID=A0A0K0XB64_MYCGD|nr:theronine dehydrogenase [Mycolicibacterium goodii]
MKAVVVHGAQDLRVEELPDPTPGEGDVLVAMEWGGICGSDISYWRHGRTGTAVLRHPMVLGHEVAGHIARVGAGVSGLRVGDRVTIHPATASGGYFGSAAFDPHTDGGFCALKVVRAEQVRVLPDTVDTARGALAEPLAVAMHAVNRAGEVRGREVLVNGAGPIGSLVVAAAKYAGATRVVAADVVDAPLAIAKAMGADEVVNLSAGGQLPADAAVTFEASGVAGALGGVLRATARNGVVVQVGNLPGQAAPASLGDLVSREITWIGSFRFVDEITDAVAALDAGLDVTPLITHRYPIDDAAQAMAVAADRTTGSGKVLLRLGG